MDVIFSHAAPSENDDQHGALPPARMCTVLVPVHTDQAFEGFTDYLHLWWPLGVYSHFGSGSHVSFSQGQMIEESEDGEQHLWGEIAEFAMAQRIVIDFSLGMESTPSTHLEFAFTEVGTGTEVSLRHDGWARGAAGQAQYQRYERWEEVMEYYARFMGAQH